MELLGSNIKKFQETEPPPKKKKQLIIHETETLKKLLIFPEMKPCSIQPKLKK